MRCQAPTILLFPSGKSLSPRLTDKEAEAHGRGVAACGHTACRQQGWDFNPGLSDCGHTRHSGTTGLLEVQLTVGREGNVLGAFCPGASEDRWQWARRGRQVGGGTCDWVGWDQTKNLTPAKHHGWCRQSVIGAQGLCRRSELEVSTWYEGKTFGSITRVGKQGADRVPGARPESLCWPEAGLPACHASYDHVCHATTAVFSLQVTNRSMGTLRNSLKGPHSQ